MQAPSAEHSAPCLIDAAVHVVAFVRAASSAPMLHSPATEV